MKPKLRDFFMMYELRERQDKTSNGTPKLGLFLPAPPCLLHIFFCHLHTQHENTFLSFLCHLIK